MLYRVVFLVVVIDVCNVSLFVSVLFFRAVWVFKKKAMMVDMCVCVCMRAFIVLKIIFCRAFVALLCVCDKTLRDDYSLVCVRVYM